MVPFLASIKRCTITDELSLSVHFDIANFTAASHEVMCDWLQKERNSLNLYAAEFCKWWHHVMLPTREERIMRKVRRDQFFEEVATYCRVSIFTSPSPSPLFKWSKCDFLATEYMPLLLQKLECLSD